MSEPTADEIARWAEQHVDGDGECWTCEQPWPCEPSRLLALVAAQAEQIDIWRGVARVTAKRADKAEAELHALHATDDYQRWARAVAERDAAREAVARVRAVCDEAERTPRGITIHGTKFPARVATTDVLAALNGGAAT